MIRKLQSDRVPPLLGTTYVCLFALAMFLVPSFFELSRYDLSGIGPREIGAVLYYGWFVTAAAYLCYFRGVSLLPSGMVAAYTAFVPASALLLAGLLLGEPVTLSLLAGLALVVAGMLLIAGPRRGHVGAAVTRSSRHGRAESAANPSSGQAARESAPSEPVS